MLVFGYIKDSFVQISSKFVCFAICVSALLFSVYRARASSFDRFLGLSCVFCSNK